MGCSMSSSGPRCLDVRAAGYSTALMCVGVKDLATAKMQGGPATLDVKMSAAGLILLQEDLLDVRGCQIFLFDVLQRS